MVSQCPNFLGERVIIILLIIAAQCNLLVIGIAIVIWYPQVFPTVAARILEYEE